MPEKKEFIPTAVWCCAHCDGHIFIADVDVNGVDDTDVIWAHLEDTGCDDPRPVPGSRKSSEGLL